MLAGTLKAVISQRLVPTPDENGRVATCEILRMTGRVRDMIMNPEETGRLPEVIAEGAYYGMQTFDQALLHHVQAGRVAMDDALKASTHPHDFKLCLGRPAPHLGRIGVRQRGRGRGGVAPTLRLLRDWGEQPQEDLRRRPGAEHLGEFQETQSQQAFALQNSKLLKVSLNQITIQAKAGSMVAYQGDVTFEHAGSGGMGRMLKKAVSGEGTTLMKMSGTGEVFLADTAQDIHLIYLENDAITVNGANLLAFDSGIDWDIQRVQGVSGMMGVAVQHRANRPAGWRSSRRPAGAVEHGRRSDIRRPRGGDHMGVELQTGIKTDIKLKNFIGRGSGESVQMSFSGTGRCWFSRARAA